MTGLRGHSPRLSGARTADDPKKVLLRVTADEQDLMGAWLKVICGVPDADVRFLTILAVPTFGGRDCVMCVPCSVEGKPLAKYRERMTITEAAQHLRESPPASRHRLVVNDAAVTVTP